MGSRNGLNAVSVGPEWGIKVGWPGGNFVG